MKNATHPPDGRVGHATPPARVREPSWDFRVDLVASAYGKFKCNLRCPFCHKDYFAQTKAPGVAPKRLEFGIELCRKFLKGNFSIHLSGSGEPLLIEPAQLADVVPPLLNINGCSSVSLTTNGYHLVDRVDQLRDLGITDINVSLPCLDADLYHRVMKVSNARAEEVITRVVAGITKARESGMKVDLNICVSYDIAGRMDSFVDFSSKYGVKIKLFPIIAVPDLNVSSANENFTKAIQHLNRTRAPEIAPGGRYREITWQLDGATVSAKPGDVFIRPYECYSCSDFMRCEESCWRSVRISPWYVQPCGIRKDNLYWYHEDNPDKLREQLVEGGKLAKTVVNHDAYFERVQEVVAEDTRHPFIVIEGPDGSGKSTITKKLAQALGFIPYRTPPSVFQVDAIKTALEQPGLEFARFLYYMASNYCASPEIRSLLLHCGVVCDRWILSTTLYHKIALGVDVPLPQKLTKELLRPDLVIILDVSEATQAARLTSRQVEFDALWEQTPLIRKAIKDAYASETGADIVHVPCDGTVDEVVAACATEITKRKLAPAVHA